MATDHRTSAKNHLQEPVSTKTSLHICHIICSDFIDINSLLNTKKVPIIVIKNSRDISFQPKTKVDLWPEREEREGLIRVNHLHNPIIYG